jgi:ssDNA-binding Zn-finger/Zn-ribbon topoisomerase 1
MANDPQEHKTAVIMLIWCGAAEARFDLSLFSDAPAVRAQAVVTGQWDPRSLLGEARRHLGRFLRGTVSVQTDTKWDLRLTSEGERLQHELRGHPENDWLVWDHVLTQRVPAQLGIRLVEGPSQTGSVTAAVAGAQANASVGNIVIQNQIDLSQLAALLRPGLGLPQEKDDSRGGRGTGGKDESNEQQWRDDALEYLPLTEIRKLIDDKLSLQTLGRLCKPDGEIRYMRRKGAGCKMHISDFRRYIKGRQSDPDWAAAYMHWLKGQKAGGKRLFWKCGNPACGYEYPDEPNATDTCPKCKGHSKLILKSPPKLGR